MSQRKDERKDTVVATTAIIRNRFISRGGAQGTITAGSTPLNATTAPLGVALFDGKIGDQIAVGCDGTQIVECAAALVAGAGVMLQADGRVIPAAPGTTTSLIYSKTTTTGAGQLAEVDIQRGF